MGPRDTPPLPATTDRLLKGLSDTSPPLLHPRYSPTKNDLVASPQIGGLTAFFPHQVRRNWLRADGSRPYLLGGGRA
jgi:hypothetical protein